MVDNYKTKNENIYSINTTLATKEITKTIVQGLNNVDTREIKKLIDFYNSRYLKNQSVIKNLANKIASQLFLLELKLRERKNKNELIK